MKLKTVLFGLIVAATLVFNATFETAIHPTVADQIAVSQLDDSDAGAIAIRAYDRFASNVPLFTWGATLGLGVLMYAGDVRRLLA